MGEVYLVRHPHLPRDEALKVLRPDISDDASFRERFIREADLAAGLRHAHIVGVHDRGEHKGRLWIAMEYIDGVDAAQLIEQRYPAGMHSELVIPIVTAIARALDYAHKKGLLHRDVKPANILVVVDSDSDDPEVFLADFGIARPLDDTNGLTTTNMTVGTVAYAAPEQLMGEHIDGRADQYALAATTYHLFTGSQLFPNSNPAVVISRHLNSLPPALADTRPDLASLDPALAGALSKDPDDRFVGCARFARALTEAASATASSSAAMAATQLALGPRKSTAAPSRPASLVPPSRGMNTATRRNRWPIAATLVFVLALAAASALVWHPWKQQQSMGSMTTTPAAPPATSTTQQAPTTSIAPPPPTTSEVPQGNGFALTGCYDSQSPPADRPAFISLLYCASGGLWLQNMSWTSWGPYGSDGTGTADVQVCVPDCADGHQVLVPVVVHAWSPLPSPGGSGCPRDIEFYANMILAFPKSEPPLEANMPALSRYNGMPAIQYSSISDPGPPIQNMASPFCT
jgi:serine/threonine-protein kinase